MRTINVLEVDLASNTLIMFPFLVFILYIFSKLNLHKGRSLRGCSDLLFVLKCISVCAYVVETTFWVIMNGSELFGTNRNFYTINGEKWNDFFPDFRNATHFSVCAVSCSTIFTVFKTG